MMEDWLGLCWILTSWKIVIFVQIYDLCYSQYRETDLRLLELSYFSPSYPQYTRANHESSWQSNFLYWTSVAKSMLWSAMFSCFSGLNQITPVPSVPCSFWLDNIRSWGVGYLGNLSKCPYFLSWFSDSHCVTCIQRFQDFSMLVVALLLYFFAAPKTLVDFVSWILQLY